MKKTIILTLLTIGFIFSGCTATHSNISKNDSSITSKQLEKKMNWKYCEESN